MHNLFVNSLFCLVHLVTEQALENMINVEIKHPPHYNTALMLPTALLPVVLLFCFDVLLLLVSQLVTIWQCLFVYFIITFA